MSYFIWSLNEYIFFNFLRTNLYEKVSVSQFDQVATMQVTS
jgi:hypothetical protein